MNQTTRPLAPKKSPSAARRSSDAPSELEAGRATIEDSTEARSRLVLAAMVAFRDGDF